MTDPSRCPQCGAEVPGDAPQGLCPKCVLKAGFSTAGSSQMWSESAAAGSVDDRFVPPTPAELAPISPTWKSWSWWAGAAWAWSTRLGKNGSTAWSH